MNPKLGASAALTGPEAEYGAQLRVAIELALADSDTPGVELVVVDDASDPERAEEAARTLIDDPAVFAVVGPMNSWTCAVQGPLFHAAGLQQITNSASSPELSSAGWRTFRRMCPADDLQGDVLAAVARRLVGARRVAALHDCTNFAEPLVHRFSERARDLGLEVEPAVGMSAGDQLDRLLEPLVARKPDALLIVGLEEPCRVAAQTLRRLGCDAVFLGTDAIKPTRVLMTDGPFAGPYLTCSTANAASVAPKLDARIRTRHGRHDSIYTVEGYDAAGILLEALRRALAVSPQRDDDLRVRVGEELDKLDDFVGAGGPIRFDDRGERVDPVVSVYCEEGSELRYLGTSDEVVAS